MRVHVRLQDACVRANSAIDALDRLAFGVIVVDQHARIIQANRAAEAMLAQGDGIGADASGLRAATPAQTASLRRLVTHAADRARVAGRGGALRLDRPSWPPALSSRGAGQRRRGRGRRRLAAEPRPPPSCSWPTRSSGAAHPRPTYVRFTA